MQVAPVQEVTPAIIGSTNVVNDYPDWIAGTYNTGDRRVEADQVYEVVAIPSTTDQPSVGAAATPPTWALIGWSNQLRMFKDGADSLSTGTGDIDVTIVYPDTISVLAALGVTGVSARLIVQDVNPNLFDFTEEFDNAYWTKIGSTIDPNVETAPDGTLTADKLIVDNLITSGSVRRNHSFVASTVYALSIYGKAAEFENLSFLILSGAFASGVSMHVRFNLNTAVATYLGGDTPISLGMDEDPDNPGWYRCKLVFTATLSASVTVIYYTNPTGDGTSGLYIWGAQLEESSTVTYYNGIVYNELVSLVDLGVSDWWEYYFLDYEADTSVLFEGVPPYPGANVRLIISGATGSDPVAVGRVASGVAMDLGVTQYGTSIDLQDYSTKERDGFGTLTLVPRRTISVVDYDVRVYTAQIDYVIRLLKSLAATPALYIGEADFKSTILYGVFDDISQGITAPSISELTIRVEEF